MPDYSTIAKCTLPTRQRDPSRESGTFLYVDIASINRESKRIEDPKETPCDQAPSRARKEIKAGDILVSTVRPNLNAVAQVPSSLDNQIASTGFAVLRPDPSLVASRYLFYRVLDPAFVDDMTSQAKGAGYPAVSDRIVGAHKLPLPPLPEQDRIVEILNQADALRQQRHQADELSQRILPALFHEKFGDLTNPKYPVGKLDSVCKRVTDGTHQSPQWEDSGIPFLMISNIVNFQLTFQTNKFISEETYRELTRRCPIEIGDVLYSTVGSFGNAALVADTRLFCFQRHIAHIKPKHEMLHPLFLWTMMNSPFVREQAESKARGIAQRTLNLSDLKSFSVIIPPLAVQESFVAQVDVALAAINDQTTSATTLETLFQSLLHSAFDGSLTAKWRESHAKELLQEMTRQAR